MSKSPGGAQKLTSAVVHKCKYHEHLRECFETIYKFTWSWLSRTCMITIFHFPKGHVQHRTQGISWKHVKLIITWHKNKEDMHEVVPYSKWDCLISTNYRLSAPNIVSVVPHTARQLLWWPLSRIQISQTWSISPYRKFFFCSLYHINIPVQRV